jgi:hypothetical protein
VKCDPTTRRQAGLLRPHLNRARMLSRLRARLHHLRGLM